MAGETEDLDALAKAKAAFYMMNDPALGANLKLRERIALAQMTRRNAYPKNFGEGLASIGDSLSDAWMARSLDKEDAAAAKSASGYTGPASAATPVAPLPPPQPRVVVPPEQVRPPPAPVPPPDGTPGNTGANTFPRPYQPPPPPLPPAPSATRSAVPPSPDVPAQPGNEFNSRFAPAVGGGQQSALPGAPVMAEGNEPSSEEMNAGRNALAQALMQQQAARGGPQPLPTTRAVTPPPAGGDTGIRAAPPAAPPVQAMPVQPGAVVGWVPESPTSKPRDRPLVGMSQEEADLTRDLAIKVQRNPYMAQSPAAMRLQTLQRDREARQKDVDKIYDAQITRETEQAKQHLDARRGQAEAIQKYGTGELEQEQKRLAIEDAREKSVLQSRFGGRDPAKMFELFDADKESAKKATHAMTQFGIAKKMIEDGVITGTNQGWKVSLAKVAAAFGSQDAAAAVSRTEEMQAAIKSTLSIAIENIQGAGGKVSDTDVRIAEGTIGADPTLQLQTIKNLVTRGEAAARQKLEGYNDQVTRYLGGTRAEPRYRVQIPGSQAATEPAPASAAPVPVAGQTPEAVAADGTVLVVRNGKWVPK